MRIGNYIAEREGAYLGMNEGKGRGKRHPFSGVHRITRTYYETGNIYWLILNFPIFYFSAC